MKALILAPFSPSAMAALHSCVATIYESWTETRRLYDPEELAARINQEGIGIVVVEADFLFTEVFEGSKPLRLVGVCRNSLNQIDVEAATAHGVAVVNVPGRNAQGVAELTLGLMLSLARRISEANEYVKEGQWLNPVGPYISMRGIELAGKTLGIVGLGAIGRKVARMGRVLDMRVLAYDPYVDITTTSRSGATPVALEELLREADFVSLHAAATEETRGLLNSSRLALLKPTTYLINTASASLVVEEALVDALKARRIAGAALDIHETHPIAPTSPFLSLDNVILTPHIGGATDGTVERQSWMLVEDIQRYLAGKRPKHLVNPEVWNRRGR